MQGLASVMFRAEGPCFKSWKGTPIFVSLNPKVIKYPQGNSIRILKHEDSAI
jgi:hypothetical protein